MEPTNLRIFAKAADFRRWLQKHHDSERELWVGLYKKGATKTAMTYVEAVDEALCFGWIDGQVRRVDDEVLAQRFSPRRPTSNWSAINIGKVARLTAEGRMHPAGIRAFEGRDRRKDASYSYERELELDADRQRRLKADDAAWAHWSTQPPGFRRGAINWVMSAKREETRERRFTELLATAAAGSRPRPFLVTREERRSSA
ncbi:MAG TPA: YdeI/OmpD-associated family protein [Candidatus Limnocylindria bacterium]|nr:YdeI/OmpD-associated family protein [Candidatus Limnocylindria bacterium]